MEKVAIITDSCADVPQEYVEKYDIYVLPMVVLCDGEEFKDGITITAQDVYQKQIDRVVKTASPSGKDILNTFETIKQKGYTHAIAVLLASGLSGTMNQVRLLTQTIDDLEIEVIDSQSGSIGYGMVVMQLAMYRNQGLSFNQLVERGQKLVANTYVYFSIDSLEYLEKGGRIGKATAFIGGIIKIKPILSFEKGTGIIYVPAKARGRKKVQPKLLDLIASLVESHPHSAFNIMVADGAMEEEHQELENQLKELYPQMKLCVNTTIGGALSTYLGPGLLGAGIQFLEDND